MAYALQSMLRIRTMREDRASADLAAARQKVRQAAQTLEERKEELREFEATKEERRDRIYEAVMGQTLTREELDRVFEGVARIDEEGALKADNVVRANAERQKCEEGVETARVNLNVATKNRMKIDEHRAVWLTEEAKAEEARAEGELEDFTVRKEEI